jgi:OOP family OmpA-OmpF porin
MRTTSRLLTAAGALLLPFAANATGNWYLGGSLGQATTDVSDGTINSRLADEGLAGSASVSDTSRLGWRLFGGYALTSYLDLEAGYTDLGEVGMTLSGTGTPSASQLEAIRPGSGAGVDLTLVGKYPFTERLSGFVRGGLFHWEQQYDLSGGDSGSFSGDDALFGVGAEWRLDERWSARLTWDRYTVARDGTDFLAVGLTYRPLTQPAPAPVAAQAVVEPPVVTVAAPPAPAVEPPAAEALEPRRWVIGFGFKSTSLTGNEPALAAMAEYLAAHAAARARITGHTDASGAEGFNPYLSRLRAKAVADALAKRGVERGRITLDAKGAGEPVADNRSRDGRARNRRVEVVIEDEAAASR